MFTKMLRVNMPIQSTQKEILFLLLGGSVHVYAPIGSSVIRTVEHGNPE